MASKKKKKTSPKKKDHKKLLKGIVVALALLLVIGGIIGVYLVKMESVDTHKKKDTFLYIPTGSTFDAVVDSLVANEYIKDATLFRWLSKRMNYSCCVRAGRYEMKSGMAPYSLISMLKSGRQKPVMLSIQKSRTKSDFTGKISKKLEVNSLELLRLLNDDAYLEQYGLNSETALTLIIPNSYEFYWNTSGENFMNRMSKENRKFWNENRLKKAEILNLTPVEVIILASIVEEETNMNSEKATIASVYLNRLRIGMKLQADPTSRFASGDFGTKRIVGKHLDTDSRYNTYEYAGLPPGPICIPAVSSIDAVLANKETNFLYFCANADFSGTHSFTSSYTDHLNNAAKYHRELNRRGIAK